jgi:capsular polysaccharide biosynthesis protein
VGPVGAGLVNIVFCDAGTPLIELLPRNLVVPDYLDLTARLGMPHFPIICAPDSASAQRAAADRHDDLTVDLEALRQALTLALAQQPAMPA